MQAPPVESVPRRWSTADIPAQHGRLAVVTGTGGLGLETALALSRAGSAVIVAGRSTDKGKDAVRTIREAAPASDVRFEVLDLASLSSVATFAARLLEQGLPIDALVNNAAVMAPPKRQVTQDGFELQLGTNYLGHFALTAQLLPLLRRARAPRVVNLSSIAARDGVLCFEDLNAEVGYKPMKVYSQSKLACLMFALELQRRSDEQGWGLTSIAAHPGVSRTELIPNSMGRATPFGLLRLLLGPILFQAAAQGALPTLFAATSPAARPGAYYGPDKLNELRGHPALARVPAQAEDRASAAKLWDESLRLTGISFR